MHVRVFFSSLKPIFYFFVGSEEVRLVFRALIYINTFNRMSKNYYHLYVTNCCFFKKNTYIHIYIYKYTYVCVCVYMCLYIYIYL